MTVVEQFLSHNRVSVEGIPSAALVYLDQSADRTHASTTKKKKSQMSYLCQCLDHVNKVRVEHRVEPIDLILIDIFIIDQRSSQTEVVVLDEKISVVTH